MPLSWRFAPEETTHFALIFEAPDARFVHWIFWDLPAFHQAVPSGANITLGGGTEGAASDGTLGYAPPCPGPGETLRFYATLYALDAPLNLPEGSSAAALRSALPNSAIAKAVLTGTYR